MAKRTKNTRLFFNDEVHIRRYEALPPEQFKKLFMTMLKYKYGDEEFINTITDPVIKALFIWEKAEIDVNEEKYAESAERSRENGKKGGRPPKEGKEPVEVEEPSNGSLEDWIKDIADGVGGSPYKAFKNRWEEFFDGADMYKAAEIMEEEVYKQTKKHLSLRP